MVSSHSGSGILTNNLEMKQSLICLKPVTFNFMKIFEARYSKLKLEVRKFWKLTWKILEISLYQTKNEFMREWVQKTIKSLTFCPCNMYSTLHAYPAPRFRATQLLMVQSGIPHCNDLIWMTSPPGRAWNIIKWQPKANSSQYKFN